VSSINRHIRKLRLGPGCSCVPQVSWWSVQGFCSQGLPKIPLLIYFAHWLIQQVLGYCTTCDGGPTYWITGLISRTLKISTAVQLAISAQHSICYRLLTRPNGSSWAVLLITFILRFLLISYLVFVFNFEVIALYLNVKQILVFLGFMFVHTCLYMFCLLLPLRWRWIIMTTDIESDALVCVKYVIWLVLSNTYHFFVR